MVHSSFLMAKPLPRCENSQSWVSAFMAYVLFCTGMCLLIWNEWWIIQAVSFLTETMGNVVTLPSAFNVMKNNDGKLVHLSGIVYTEEPLVVNEYGIAVSAVKLKHRVQMYQWVQECISGHECVDNENNTKLYRYFTDWKDRLINSSKFIVHVGHENPSKFPFKTTVYMSERVVIGRFSLSTALKQKFNSFVTFTSDERPEQKHIKMHSGLYYHSHDVWNPEVGDIRIQFSYAGMAGEYVTILAKQVGTDLHPYDLPSGMTIALVRSGTWSAMEMIHGDNTTCWGLWWTLRAVGWLCVFLGTNCSSILLQLLVCRSWSKSNDVTLSFISARFTFSVSISLFIISLTWMHYQPILGLSIFAISLIPLVFIIMKCNVSELHKLH